MSKNKFIKKLLLTGLCALTATAMIGATACGGNNDKDPDPDQDTVIGDDNENNENENDNVVTEYTVTFNLNGGSWDRESLTLKVEAGETLPADLEEPTCGNLEFTGWFLGAAKYIPGETVITKNVTLTASWHDPIDDLDGSWYVEKAGSADGVGVMGTDGKITGYEEGDEIAETDFYTITSAVATQYSVGSEYGKIENLTVKDNEMDQGLIPTEDTAQESCTKAIYEVTAKITCKISLYLNVVNLSYNSNRAGAQIIYSLSGNESVALFESSVNRTSSSAGQYVTLTAVIPEGETLTVGVNNILTQPDDASKDNNGRLWLFGADAQAVKGSVTVNYYCGEDLIGEQIVESGAKLTTPKLTVLEEGKELDGWYTAAQDGEEYTFGTLATDVTEVDVYAVLNEIDESQITGKILTNKTTLKLYMGDEEPIEGGIAADAEKNVWTNVSADVFGKVDESDDNEEETKLGTVTISSITADSNTTAVRLRVPNNSTLKFELEEGYTYSITISASSSGADSARTITLTGANEYSSANTDITTNSYVDCTWSKLNAGTYTAAISGGNVNIQYITIVATPIH